jgi:4-hydroxy-tetrahydrodipicolinate reductase
MSLNIALIGYGRMGNEVAVQAKNRGHVIISTYDEIKKLKSNLIDPRTDIFIDFSTPQALLENFKIVAEARKPIVIGTTGWQEQKNEIKRLTENANIAVIHAANFSIGMNIFYKITECAAILFNQFVDYDAFIHEIHHRMKIDSPSGTALTLGEILLSKIQRKNQLLVNRMEGKISDNQLHISSTRSGAFPGTHIVAFDSIADTIELKHTVRNRSGFAIGAIYAAEWLIGRRGFYSMQDMIDEIIK